MTIWILGLLCVGIAGYAGYARGAIRVAMSLLGILVGLMVAPALGPMVAPVMRMMISNVLLADALAPLAVFLVVVIAFKGGAAALHSKIETHFRYKTTDTRLLHWERLMARMGGCLGLINGTLYFYVLCAVFYISGYLTMQITTPENSTASSKLINLVAKELNNAGMQTAIVAIDPMPAGYYDAADVLGHVHHNPLLLSRLGRYPAFLSMAERPEFQEISTDPQVNELIQTHSSVSELLEHPKIKALMANPAIVDEFKTLDYADLKAFVETGDSAKYEEVRILGRWNFNLARTLEQIRVVNPSISAKNMQNLGRQMEVALIDSTFTATTDNQAFIKSVPPAPIPQPGQPIPPAPTGPAIRVASGTWSETGGSYTVTFTTVDNHPFYAFANGTARVRFLENTIFLEFPETALAYTIDF